MISTTTSTIIITTNTNIIIMSIITIIITSISIIFYLHQLFKFEFDIENTSKTKHESMGKVRKPSLMKSTRNTDSVTMMS